MIRNAQIADIPQLIALGKRLLELTPYADVKIDTLIAGQTLGQCINSAFGIALVAVHEGKITGLLLGAAVPLWFSKSRSATDIVTYAETPGDGYRMIRRFIRWAWAVPNVIEVTMAQSSGVDVERTGKLYERVGLARVGAIYTAVREPEAAEVAA
jgi:hypothetical protein